MRRVLSAVKSEGDTLAFLVGFGLLLAGAARLSTTLALIVAGVVICTGALLAGRSA